MSNTFALFAKHPLTIWDESDVDNKVVYLNGQAYKVSSEVTAFIAGLPSKRFNILITPKNVFNNGVKFESEQDVAISVMSDKEPLYWINQKTVPFLEFVHFQGLKVSFDTTTHKTRFYYWKQYIPDTEETNKLPYLPGQHELAEYEIHQTNNKKDKLTIQEAMKPLKNLKVEIVPPPELAYHSLQTAMDKMLTPSHLHAASPEPDSEPLGDSVYVPSNSAVENHSKLNYTRGVKLKDLEALKPENRTLVVVYGSRHSREDFRERVRRLIGSLNMADTIKAVVITVCGGDVYHGLELHSPPGDGEIDQDVLERYKLNFAQVVEVKDER